MRVNLEWLGKWVRLDSDAEAIAADLTAAGLEVDSIEPAAGAVSGIVVGEVVRVEQHPNADRLSVCAVRDGNGEHQVVCGARNVAAGIKVPFATVGSRLPDGRTIGRAALRGVESSGMLCSAKELGLVDDVDGLLVLDAGAVVGEPLADHLHLDDTVFEINVTPNRGDCFSVVGIARELAARRGVALTRPRASGCAAAIDERFPVALNAGAACPRFAGRVVRGLRKDARTPLWMRERLRRAGLRPLQPIVDVTNYVMLELGQPLHAYDLAKLEDGIEVRLARPGESLILLDGRSVTLEGDILVIADARHAVGLAGVMGGQHTAVSGDTDSVFLESAFFAPSAIAGRARRLGLHTDASLRFERGVDPQGQAGAVDRAAELIVAICGGSAGPTVEVERAADVPRRNRVALRRARLESMLGLAVPVEQVAAIFERLEMGVEKDAEGWQITPPSFRFDIAIEEDLVEEVGRMVGYDAIPPTPARATETLGRATETAVSSDRLADTLVARGYSEAVTYSFIDSALDARVHPERAGIELANPIASDLAILRQSLWPGLISTARLNVTHQRSRLKIFEIGPQFSADGDRVKQTAMVAGLALGARSPEHWDGARVDLDYFDIKGDVEALLRSTGAAEDFRFEPASHPALTPGRSARIVRSGQPIGWLGVLHPDLQKRIGKWGAAIVFELDLTQATRSAVPVYRRSSKFPSLRRDLAILVADAVTAEALTGCAKKAAGELLREVVVFDVYRGQGVDSGRKSVGLGLILQDASRTLTDEDADQKMRAVMLALEHEFGASIRT
jgi:phenylalanyl-tRNA synthetase beta chain